MQLTSLGKEKILDLAREYGVIVEVEAVPKARGSYFKQCSIVNNAIKLQEAKHEIQHIQQPVQQNIHRAEWGKELLPGHREITKQEKLSSSEIAHKCQIRSDSKIGQEVRNVRTIRLIDSDLPTNEPTRSGNKLLTLSKSTENQESSEDRFERYDRYLRSCEASDDISVRTGAIIQRGLLEVATGISRVREGQHRIREQQQELKDSQQRIRDGFDALHREQQATLQRANDSIERFRRDKADYEALLA